ncbi:YraN family protein [Pseudahrensia aquimaris]|uniref:UPF0102 protein ACFQ14_11020 n=1 Tax=Pseudahrensia aquimaris TaxID=744461 RepID=A0ABW3FGB3_9HYPH
MLEKKQAAYKRGVVAEDQAARFLSSHGWEILETRYKTKAGEVDLIALKDSLVIFVEVKARANTVSALESVSAKSKARIKAAGQGWLLQQEDHARLSWRCDLIAIVPNEPPVHIEGAW